MKVIIADDDPTTLLVLSGIVKKMGFDVVAVPDGAAALDAYQQETTPCLMIVDWEMPELNGIQLCQQVKDASALNPPYIILLTGRQDPTDIAEGLEKGADDYICKPFNTPELMARIKVAKRTLDIHRQLHETQRALKYQATHDELTGLMNRRAAFEALTKEAARAERMHHMLHIAICDLDNFKDVNDTFGHFFGDQVLQRTAAIMQRIFRPYDLICRFGGEEFLIAISHEKNQEGVGLFQRLLTELSEHPFAVSDHQQMHITMSIGLCSGSGDCLSEKVSDMLLEADRCLYQAKVAGKNRVICTDHSCIKPSTSAS
jgi:two-component system cell cycle response regulator